MADLPPDPPMPSQWGDWVFNEKMLTLTCIKAGYELFTGRVASYEIDLEDITDSAQMLDWIFQIQRKTWATPQIVGDLVAALADLFDPQASLCSFGQNKNINPAKLLRKRLKESRARPQS